MAWNCLLNNGELQRFAVTWLLYSPLENHWEQSVVHDSDKQFLGVSDKKSWTYTVVVLYLQFLYK